MGEMNQPTNILLQKLHLSLLLREDFDGLTSFKEVDFEGTGFLGELVESRE